MWDLKYSWGDEAASGTEHIGTFTNKDVADLVCEQLEGLTDSQKQRHHMSHTIAFYVVPATIYQAESESRVGGIVQDILNKHFPKRF